MTRFLLEEPQGPRRGLIPRVTLPKLRISKAGRRYLGNRLEEQLVGEVDSEFGIAQLERKTVALEGVLNSDSYLEDRANKLRALTEARKIDYREAVEAKDFNAIARYWARGEDLKEMHPEDADLGTLIEEERHRYRLQRRRHEVIE